MVRKSIWCIVGLLLGLASLGPLQAQSAAPALEPAPVWLTVLALA